MFITAESAQQIVTEIKAIIHYDLNMMDKDGSIIASTDPLRIGQQHSGVRQIIEEKLEVLIIRENDEEQGQRPGVNLPIILDGEIAGVIGITGDPEKVSVLGSVIKKMVELMITEMRQQELSNLCETARFNFVEQWLFTRVSSRQNFETQARLLDIDVNAPRILAVFVPDTDWDVDADTDARRIPPERMNEEVLKHLRINAEYDSRNLCLTVNRNYLVMFAERDIETVRRCATAICHELKNFFGMPVYCGISSVAEDYQQVSVCYKEALAACRTVASSKIGFLAAYNDTSPMYILQSIPRDVLERLENAVFRDCPEAEKDELLHTLKFYFKHDGNSAAAAAELYIHPNTFLYRLKKVTAATGLDPRKPKDMALLYLLSIRYILDTEI